MKTDFVLGDVVLSRKGRDKDNYFVVVKILSDDFVEIADGELHMLKKSKKKNKKHLKFANKNLEVIASKLEQNKKVFDSELKSALRAISE